MNGGGGVNSDQDILPSSCCEHHPEHTADCGYAKARLCGHEHTEDCYTHQLICEYNGERETTASYSSAEHTHTQGCYGLDCPHERGAHDDGCGYVEAQPCNFQCPLCAPKGSGLHTKASGPVVQKSTSSNAVPKSQGTITVTDFDQLAFTVKSVPLGTRWDSLNLPAALGAFGFTVSSHGSPAPDPEPITIQGVTWEVFEKSGSPSAYVEGRTSPCIYWLRAVLPERYTLADGVSCPEIELRYGISLRTGGRELTKGNTLAGIGAKTGDVVTIKSDFSGEVSIPADIKTLTLKSDGALTGVYITSEDEIALTIDGLDITAPTGTDATAWSDVTGSYPAISLAGDSRLTVKGSNRAVGGIESAGIRVSAGQGLTIGGDGDLAVYGGAHKTVNGLGGTAIGGNGSYVSGSATGEKCGRISIEDTVTLTLEGSLLSAELGCGDPYDPSGTIAVSGEPVILSSGGLKVDIENIIVDGGTLNVQERAYASPVNSKGAPLNQVDIPAGDAGRLQVKKIGDSTYSYRAFTQSDGSAYIWLPVGASYEVHVDRGNHTDVYLVDNLSVCVFDGAGKLVSNVTYARPNASYSSELKVSSVVPSSTSWNSGTVTVTFNQVPDDDTDGIVSVSRDGFISETALTLESTAGKTYTYSYANLHEGTYTICVKGFKDSRGYENETSQSATFTTKNKKVTVDTISGVTVPVPGAKPVTQITGTQYTGTVTWSPSPAADGAFAGNEIYTATITLTPKSGYTFTGVPSDFFKVTGAMATNPKDSGIITAVFPKTDWQVHSVTIADDGNGRAGASPASAKEGAVITLSATANSGYHFKEWLVISGGITIENNQFSMPDCNVTVKAVFEKNRGSSGGSSSEGDSSYINPAILRGTWIQTDTGSWTFLQTDGSYARNRWGMDGGLWYYFDAEGRMMTGWQFINNQWYYLYTKGDAGSRAGVKEGAMALGWYFDPICGKWFYLDPEGVMVTGWREIHGKWYYFNPVSDGTRGSMVTDRVIDGWYVDKNGVWDGEERKE